MVTHSSTSRPVQCLCMAERTGCPVFTDLWSYVSVSPIDCIISLSKQSLPLRVRGSEHITWRMISTASLTVTKRQSLPERQQNVLNGTPEPYSGLLMLVSRSLSHDLIMLSRTVYCIRELVYLSQKRPAFWSDLRY